MDNYIRTALLTLALAIMLPSVTACGGSAVAPITFQGDISRELEDGSLEPALGASVASYVYVPIGGRARQEATPVATAQTDLAGHFSLSSAGDLSDQKLVFNDPQRGSLDVSFTGIAPGVNITVNPKFEYDMQGTSAISGSVVDATFGGQISGADLYIYVPPPPFL